MLRIAGNNPSRNRPCPCGSGSKYERCHLDEAPRLVLLDLVLPGSDGIELMRAIRD